MPDAAPAHAARARPCAGATEPPPARAGPGSARARASSALAAGDRAAHDHEVGLARQLAHVRGLAGPVGHGADVAESCWSPNSRTAAAKASWSSAVHSASVECPVRSIRMSRATVSSIEHARLGWLAPGGAVSADLSRISRCTSPPSAAPGSRASPRPRSRRSACPLPARIFSTASGLSAIARSTIASSSPRPAIRARAPRRSPPGRRPRPPARRAPPWRRRPRPPSPPPSPPDARAPGSSRVGAGSRRRSGPSARSSSSSPACAGPRAPVAASAARRSHPARSEREQAGDVGRQRELPLEAPRARGRQLGQGGAGALQHLLGRASGTRSGSGK